MISNAWARTCICSFISITFSLPALASDMSETLPFSQYFKETQEAQNSRLGVQLDLGVTFDFISALKALMNSSGSSIQLERTLEHRYGSNQETFSKFKIGYYHPTNGLESSLLNSWYLEGAGEFGFFGVAENPVFSELHGRIIYMGMISTGITEKIPLTPIQIKTGVVLGKGIGRHLDVISPDLVNSSPPIQEDLQLYGIDLGISATPRSTDSNYEVGTSLDYRGTAFLSSLDSTAIFVHRWKSFSYLENLSLTETSGIRIRPHLIFGKQPLPLDLLPRSWDYIHPLSIPSDLLVWSGLGVDLSLASQNRKGIKGTIGFYGKLLGGSLSYELGPLFVRAGTWAICVGPNFQADIERFWQGALGFEF